MLSVEEFEREIGEVLATAGKDRHVYAPDRVKICTEIYKKSVESETGGINHADLAALIYTDIEPTYAVDSLRKQITEIEEAFEQYFTNQGGNIRGYKAYFRKKALEGLSKEKLGGKRGKTRNFYRIHLTRDYLTGYAGRKKENEMFKSLLDNLHHPKKRPHILSLYGFGGVGKSTLLQILRGMAEEREIIVEPEDPNDENLWGSISDWMKKFITMKGGKAGESHKQIWLNFIDFVKPGSIVLIDGMANVGMKEYNTTFQAISNVFWKSRPHSLIVTATREKPSHLGETYEVKGLSAEEINELVGLQSWNPDILNFTDELVRQTGGNTFMIRNICRNEDLWKRFTNGTLDFRRHSDPTALLLKEMFESLSETGRKALEPLSVLGSYSARWRFPWGRKECLTLLGNSWDEIQAELHRKCFIEEENDFCIIHEFITDYVISDLKNRDEWIDKIGKIFSSSGDEELALRFHVETGKIQRIRKSFGKGMEKVETWTGYDMTRGKIERRYLNMISLIEGKILPLTEKDDDFRGEVLKKLGFLYDMTSNFNNASKSLEEAKKIFQKTSNAEELSEVLVLEGDLYRDYAHFQEALKIYSQNLKGVKRTQKLLRLKAESLWGIGEIHRLTANYKKASQHLEEAKKIFIKIKDNNGISDTLWSQGYTSLLTGQYKEAEEALNKILDMHSTGRVDEFHKASALGAMADIYRLTERYEESAKIYREAEESMNIQENQGMRAWILAVRTHSLMQLKKMKEARESVTEAENIARKNNDILSLTWALQARAELERQEGQAGQAKKLFEESQQLSETHGLRLELAHSHLGLAGLSRGKGASLYEKALRIYKDIGCQWGIKECKVRMESTVGQALNFP
jgi:tetratricopeptide (TPR) repeat protein